MPRLAALLLLTATLLQAAASPAGAVAAVARPLQGLIGRAGNHCHLVGPDGSRRRVVIDRLPHALQRRPMLGCPATRGCPVRPTAVADSLGALRARDVAPLDA